MRSKNLPVIMLCFMVLAILTGSTVDAMVVRAGENVFVNKEETLAEDIALFAGEISVAGYVDADVIAFCQKLDVTGIINHDLLGGAERIKITGQVGDDLRVGAREVHLHGPVGDDAIVFCQIFTQGEDSRVGGEIQAWCQEATLRGDVDQNVQIVAQTAEIYGHIGGNITLEACCITLAGSVDGNAELEGQSINLLPGCVIAGDLKYTSPEELEFEEGVQILGAVAWEQLAPEVETWKKESILGDIMQGVRTFMVLLKLTLFVGQIIVGLILIGIFRKETLKMVDALVGNFWKSLGIGVIFSICGAIIFGVLLFTLIGLPLGVLGLLVYTIIWYLSPIVVALAFGGKIVGAMGKDRTAPWVGALLIGLTILRAISFIPVFGFFVQLFVLFFGMGAIIVAWKSAYAQSRVKSTA
ncbi:hypothetical protein ACFL0G_06235 [Candidatus Zixiibacteriota bacterium]